MDYITLNFQNITIVNNNFFSNSLFLELIFAQYSKSMVFANLNILENTFMYSILLIVLSDMKNLQTITMTNINVIFNNLNRTFFSTDPSQNFFFMAGYFYCIFLNNNFFKNICFIGPCVFYLYSLYYIIVFIESSNFSNNLAYYANDSDIPGCVLIINGIINLTLNNVLMRNNSIHYYNEQLHIGSKGCPCIIGSAFESNLTIENSRFLQNFGNSVTSCIFFIGHNLNVLNTTFEKQRTNYANQTFVLWLDFFVMIFNNVNFSNNICGTIILTTSRELTYFTGEDIVIYNNFALMSSIVIVLKTFYLKLSKLKFISNISVYRGSFIYLYTAIGTKLYDFLITDSQFINNLGLNTPAGLYEIRVVTMNFNNMNCLYFNNSADMSNKPGVFYINSENLSMLIFSNCTFLYNYASSGSIFYILLAEFRCQNCKIIQNIINISQG